MPKNSSKQEKRAIVKYFETIFSNASKLILLNLAYFAFLIPTLAVALTCLCLLFNVSNVFVEKIYILQISVRTFTFLPFPLLITLLVVSIIAYGPLTAGLTYCVKKIVNREHVFVLEMFSQAKSNFKQGLAFGLLDLVIFSSCFLYLASDASVLQGFNFISYQIMRIIAIIVSIIYICVRFYSYTIAVTFELSIKDIIKNSLIFCVLGFFKNILAIIVCAFIILSFISTPRIDLVLLAVLVFSLCRFTAVFLTYPIIDEYMLKRIEKEKSASKESKENE